MHYVLENGHFLLHSDNRSVTQYYVLALYKSLFRNNASDKQSGRESIVVFVGGTMNHVNYLSVLIYTYCCTRLFCTVVVPCPGNHVIGVVLSSSLRQGCDRD